MTNARKFNVALSFAGEDRPYVDQVAVKLKEKGISVFYDLFEEADLWGRDLYVHLTDVYQKQAQYTVMFVSEAYRDKLWTNHERRAAQARAFQESQEYILPARFDDTEIPGLLGTVGYVSLQNRSPENLVSLIAKKLVSSGGSVPSEQVRRDFSTMRAIPRSAATDMIVQIVNDQNEPISDAHVVAMADNGTKIESRTDEAGIARLQISVRRRYRVLIAHPEYPAATVEKADSAESYVITLPRTDNVGSTIMHSTGYIPGLKGRLNPIRDTSNRTYLYADNIAIDGGKPQPTSFDVGEPIELEDSNGVITYATVVFIEARTALVQHLRV